MVPFIVAAHGSKPKRSLSEYPTETNPVSILCCNRKWGDFSLLFIVTCCINQCFAEDCEGSFLLLFSFRRNSCVESYRLKQLKFLSPVSLNYSMWHWLVIALKGL